MPGISNIRIKALLLSAIFAGNFFAVCHCAAGAVASTSAIMRMNGNYTHCCCRQKRTIPSEDGKRCPGTRAVKFNLLEKKAAATIGVNPAEVISVAREYNVPAIEGNGTEPSVPSWYLPPHAPPNRLALYQCFLI
jgi:hypothetical protein